MPCARNEIDLEGVAEFCPYLKKRGNFGLEISESEFLPQFFTGGPTSRSKYFGEQRDNFVENFGRKFQLLSWELHSVLLCFSPRIKGAFIPGSGGTRDYKWSDFCEETPPHVQARRCIVS
jgi:hypothetical protein